MNKILHMYDTDLSFIITSALYYVAIQGSNNNDLLYLQSDHDVATYIAN